MKKILVLASFMMLSVAGWAQHEVGKVTIQPKVGLNIANYRTSESTDPRVALAAGVELEYQVTNIFSLSAGMLYSMQGAKSSEYASGYNVKTTAKTDYLNIPIMANFYVAKGLAVKFGIQPAFNVTANYEVSTAGVSVSGSLSDLGVDVNTFDFSIPVGLSYEFSNVVIDHFGCSDWLPRLASLQALILAPTS